MSSMLVKDNLLLQLLWQVTCHSESDQQEYEWMIVYHVFGVLSMCEFDLPLSEFNPDELYFLSQIANIRAYL